LLSPQCSQYDLGKREVIKNGHSDHKIKTVRIRRSEDQARAKAAGHKDEAETIDRALDELISERERSARAWRATQRFIKSRVEIEDVYGRLTDPSAYRA
jgi:hypothetical protein